MSNVVSHSEKMCEPVEYYNDVMGTEDLSNLCEIPTQNNVSISTISDYTPSQYSSFCSSGFSDMDTTTTTFTSIPFPYTNNNSYGTWNFGNDSGHSNLNNYGYCNYIQEIDNNNSNNNNNGAYQSYYNQGYPYNNSTINTYNDSSLTYLNEAYDDRTQTSSFQTTDLEGSQVIGNTCNEIPGYHTQDQQIEELSNYDQTYTIPQYQLIDKDELLSQDYQIKQQSYMYNYPPEVYDVVDFFRYNKKLLFEKRILSIDSISINKNDNNTNNIINDISINNMCVDDDGDHLKDIPLKVQKMDDENKSFIDLDTIVNNNNNDGTQKTPKINIIRKFDNEMVVEDIEVFATNFKNQRISYGFTQGDVGRHIGLRFGSEFSQTTISRFEALNLSCKNMLKLKPKLEEWLNSTQQLFQQGYTALEINEQNLHNRFPKPSIAEQEAKQIAEIKKVKRHYRGENLRKRRKRTNLIPEQRNILYVRYLEDSRPSDDALKKIAKDIDLDISVVKIWFCNRRQKEKKSTKKEEE